MIHGAGLGAMSTEKSFTPAGNQTPAAQPVARRYAD
jgi:hypothetical protein